MEKLNGYILQKAKEAGICQQWAQRISNTHSPDHLLAMYRAGIDFCLSNNFPSNVDLKRLGGRLLSGHGIYVDEIVTLLNKEFTVLLGKSNATLTIDNFNTSQIFVKHDSTANLVAIDDAFVVVDCFDNSELKVASSDRSKILINVYGQAKVTYDALDTASVKIVHKNKETY